jgi:hypothetical protein
LTALVQRTVEEAAARAAFAVAHHAASGRLNNAAAVRALRAAMSSRHTRESQAGRVLAAWLGQHFQNVTEDHGRITDAEGIVVSARVLPFHYVLTDYYDGYAKYINDMGGKPLKISTFKYSAGVVMKAGNIVRRVDTGNHCFCTVCNAWKIARGHARDDQDLVRSATLAAEYGAHLEVSVTSARQLISALSLLAAACAQTTEPPAWAAAPPAHAPAATVSLLVTDRPSSFGMMHEARASKYWARSPDFYLVAQGVYSAADGGQDGSDSRISLNYSTRLFTLGSNKTIDALIPELLRLPVVPAVPRTVFLVADNCSGEVRSGADFW